MSKVQRKIGIALFGSLGALAVVTGLAGATVAAREPKSEEGVYRSDNFLATAPSREAAEQVAKASERHRKTLALLWLGKEAPPWAEPCEVRLEAADNAPNGFSALGFKDGRVVMQSMHLNGRLDAVLEETLPHEVAHVVLAHWFGRPLPRWADEGAAVLCEPPASRDRYDRRMRDIMDAGRLMGAKKLLPMHGYPPDLGAFYAESYSLTDFLVRRGGHAKFLAFVAQGEKDGWEDAAKSQYGYASLDALEAAWLGRVREGEAGEGRP